ncbi:RNA polymerase II mediator complex subunit [Maudiozyma exigua]|uniref:Mediator of RNA polymerase II transcription subunit 17 n=1 Tax=Maudiozyma exigua TaxID=34358 RepID=A0A9P6WCZ2_MAUEX|nr:RNA polymerase II mediator complex subunit [Kazachstania exigua]
MSESMTPAQGIDLALDPNLLSLPKPPNQSISPIIFTGTPSNETTQDTETANNTEFNSLVNNPFEIYGNMPLSQLVPLILQQKQLTFAQLSQTKIEQDLHDIDNITTTNISEGETTTTTAVAAAEDIPEIVTEPQQDTAKPVITGANSEALNPITLEKIRGAMIEQINIAMNESSLALETVSLLLSSVRENNAKSSLSPYLKRTVPMGSLNGDNVPIGKDVTNQLRTVQFGIGWKLKSLEESRNILRDTVDSLWTIMSKEHSYWKKISEVITNSDVIFKIRERNSSQRVLGIKYGYEDSGSTYRLDHGIALLRNNEEMNKLELIPFNSGDNKHQLSNNGKNITSPGMRNLGMTTPAGTVAAQNISSIMNDNNGYYSQLPMKYYLRVRIFTKIEYEDDYILSGESSIDPKFHQIGNIRNQIDKFKDIIFEKELMYQLKKECSTLISYGVRIENENKITIELPQEKFEIELIGVHEDEMDNTMNNNTNGRINDKRANLILITLRMLLVVVFKKNLRRRISNSIDSPEELLLIRPILGKLRHSNYKKLLMRIIQENVMNVVKDSTIETINKQETTINQQDRSIKDKHIEQINKDIKSFDSLLRMPITQFNVQLNNKTSNLEIILRTTNYCNAIIVITYYNIVTEKIIFDTSFTEFKEIEEFLHFLINEYVIE